MNGEILTLLLMIAAAAAIAALLYSLHQAQKRLRIAEAAAAAGSGHEQSLERARAVAEERERIYNDLHDDIGARLLDLVFTAQNPAHADMARTVLQDLRDVVSRSRGAPGSLLEVLGEIRAETEARMELLHVELEWLQDGGLPDPQLDEAQSLHLFRIVREAVTNAVRHARASRVRIRAQLQAKELLLDVTDDGGGAMPAEKAGAGRGTSGMQARAAELRGSIKWDPGTLGGTKVVLRFPLPA